MNKPTMSKTQLLNEVAAGRMTPEEAAQHLDAMATPRPLTLRVSNKGCLSIYGLQKLPVTLYASQWSRIFNHMEEIRAFIEANADRLKRKDKLKRESIPDSESFEA